MGLRESTPMGRVPISFVKEDRKYVQGEFVVGNFMRKRKLCLQKQIRLCGRNDCSSCRKKKNIRDTERKRGGKERKNRLIEKGVQLTSRMLGEVKPFHMTTGG